jgi:hypothetical protein
MVTAFEFPIVPGIRFVVRERIDAAAAVGRGVRGADGY